MANRTKSFDPYWGDLEDAVRAAAIAGGMASMSYFRGALADQSLLDDAINAATNADVQSTAAILLSLNTTIPHLAGQLNMGHAIFAEELDGLDPHVALSHLIDRLGSTSAQVKKSANDFESSFDSCIGVLFDAIDGTTNFRAGLPLFCSAIALFLEGAPRVAAVYDPARNVVYYGSLRVASRPLLAEASIWHVSSGLKQQLSDRPLHEARPQRLLSMHLTRSDAGKRAEMLAYIERLKYFERLKRTEGLFMINSGQLSLALVASGHFAAYVNNYTNTWDIAAGEVLVRAVGGRVTDFDGNPIKYSDQKVNVIASTDTQFHDDLLSLVADTN